MSTVEFAVGDIIRHADGRLAVVTETTPIRFYAAVPGYGACVDLDAEVLEFYHGEPGWRIEKRCPRVDGISGYMPDELRRQAEEMREEARDMQEEARDMQKEADAMMDDAWDLEQDADELEDRADDIEAAHKQLTLGKFYPHQYIMSELGS